MQKKSLVLVISRSEINHDCHGDVPWQFARQDVQLLIAFLFVQTDQVDSLVAMAEVPKGEGPVLPGPPPHGLGDTVPVRNYNHVSRPQGDA